MEKPANPYPKGSILWSVMEGDWGDLTVSQIAGVLDATVQTVSSTIYRIRKETGYDVPRKRAKR